MAAPVLSGWRQRLAGRAWLWVAVLVGGGLLAAALLSPDRQQQLQEHVASGPMREVAATQVLRVSVQQGDRQWQFQRQGPGWTVTPMRSLPPAQLSEQVNAALRLLRNAAVERELDTDSPDFALATAQTVQVRVFTSAAADAPAAWAFDFGAGNPVGLARYTRVRGGDTPAQLVLLPSYVAEAWEQAVGVR